MAQDNPPTEKPTTPTSGIGISVQQGSTQGNVQSGKVQSTPSSTGPSNNPKSDFDPSQAPSSMSTGKKIGIALLGIIIIFGLVYVLYLRPSNNTTTSIINQIIPPPEHLSGGRAISSCTSINSPGNYYLSGNVSAGTNKSVACISIASSNVILNGKGKRIIGSGPYVQIPPYSYGIEAENVTNVTISNFTVLKFSYDIYLKNVSNSKVYNSNALNGTISGIYLEDSNKNIIRNNTVFASSGAEGGIGLQGGGNNTILGNLAVDNAYYGMWINSSGNTFRNDHINGNPIDLACGSNAELRYTNQFINSSCVVNNHCNFAYCSSKNTPASLLAPLPSNIKTCGLISSPGTYEVSSNINMSYYTNTTSKFGVNACITINSPHVTLNCNNNTIYNAGYGIYLSGYYSDAISNCRMYNNTYGIYMANSFDDNITNSSASAGKYGAYFMNDTNFNVSNMNFAGDNYGMYLNSSFALTFNKINSTSNKYGVYYGSGSSSSFFGSKFQSNSEADFFCSTKTYNSSFETFQGNSCGLTDCNWASSCTARELVPLPTYPIFSCGTISVPGNYSLSTGLLSSSGNSCISITSSNVKLDCNGKIIEGGLKGNAFSISSANNVSLLNCDLSGFNVGINADSVKYLSISNTIVNKVTNGIVLSGGNFSTISDVKITNFTGTGFSFTGTNNSAISNDTADSGITNASGFTFTASDKNIITGNTGSSNPSYGFIFADSRGNLISNNTAVSNSKYDYACNSGSSGIYANNGRVNTGITKENCLWMVMSPPISTPSCYSISKPSYVQLQQDVLYTSGSTCYYIFNSNSSSGKQTTINCNGHTVYAPNGGTFADINGAESTIIENCYLIGFSKGVVSNARNTKIINSTIANAQYSVILNGTSYSNVENDTFNNDTYGVYSQSSSYGVISNNNFINPGYGIYLLGGTAFRIIGNHIGSAADTAISLLNSQLDQLQNNLANGNAFGISCSQYSTNSSSNLDLGGNSCNSNNNCVWMTASQSCKV